MQKQTHPSELYDHLHYHYHYYNPSNIQAKQKKDISQTLSRSVSYDRRREESFQATPESTKSKMQTEPEQAFSGQKWAKMHMSSTLNNNFLDRETPRNEFSHIKARSVVEQQLRQSFQERESGKSTRLTAHNEEQIQPVRRVSTQNLIAHYEQELQKYRAELGRLKMVEEECVYLRDTFYNHYQEKCNDKD